MVDPFTNESIIDTKKGLIREGDLILVTAHTVKQKNIRVKVNLEMLPCLDE
jgi:hypothetical protein